ncbi:MAG: branched-chain amino acid ABC transporter ATP-binding protein/permease [Pseudomonadota bacterium]|nr:branched-chain amino acid ABC transporter ATP-binding protein/permease [Pseudomonadota bacterium]
MKRYAPFAIFAAALVIGVFVLPVFYINVLTYIGIYTLVALGLVLITGVCGITSFGQAAFVGIAAYATGYVSVTMGLSPWIGLVVAVVITAAAAALIGLATLKLSGHYLPLSTLAWGIALYFLFGNFEFLGGHTGMGGIPAIAIGPIHFHTIQNSYLLTWVIAIACMIGVANLLRSSFGRSLYAVRGDASMAESFGISSMRAKLVAFTLAAVLAALSGWLYAHTLRFINPTPFNLHIGIEYLFMAVVGGVGYVWGAVIGAAAIAILKQLLQDVLPSLMGTSGNYETIVLSILMVILLQYANGGVAGMFRKLRPAKHSALEGVETSEELPPAMEHHTTDTVLAVEGITKKFDGLVAVNKVSFTVPRGEIIGLIGPNGAGKSTMFNLVSGLLPPTEGKVTLNGHDVTAMSASKIAKLGLARTFQHVHLLKDMSVVENVMIGAHLRQRSGVLKSMLGLNLRDEARLKGEAMRQLAKVGLAEQAHVPAGSLSLGQQRMLEIARALCADPELLLLDEPAAGLRHFEKDALAQVLLDLKAGGLSILIVEHDMRFISSIVDGMVVMDFGTWIAAGAPDRVKSDPKVIEAYLGAA